METIAIPWTTARRHVLAKVQRQPLLRSLQTFAARAGVSLFVVGGTTRDVCLGRDIDDIDVAFAGDVMAFARAFANAVGGAYVPLDAPRGEARVVYHKRHSVDFARLRGREIGEDLRRRDFTINALACPLTSFLLEPEPVFIDPLSGWSDLQARLIRVASPQSFEDDPLRLLRAFRLAATLEFTLEASTQEAMQPVLSRLADMAAERVQSELFKLLTAPHSHLQVDAMAQVGLLTVLFPELDLRSRPVEKDAGGDRGAPALLTYHAVEALIEAPTSVVPLMAEPIAQYVQAHERAALLKWAALLHGAGPLMSLQEGKETPRPCFTEARRAAEIWERVVGRLKLSRARTDYVRRIIAHTHRLCELAIGAEQGGLTLRVVHQWFKELGEDALGVFVLAIGVALAGQGLGLPTDRAPALERLAAYLWALYRSRIVPVLQAPRLVTGDDLHTLFGLPPGPLFKTLLEELELAQVEGHISTRDEAIGWLRQRLLSG
jgi:poly(A) polymerase